MNFFIFVFLLGGISQVTQAKETLFEGYSKIISNGQHIGYSIVRYQVDLKKKQWIATTFLRTNPEGGGINEKLTAVATDDMTPVSYDYTFSVAGGVNKTVDAKFSGGKMQATINETGKPVQKVNIKVPKGAFLSSFLVYVMSKSPKGLAADTKYNYEAIAEEDASLQKGMAFIKSLEEFNGRKAYRILNEFKGSQFISFVNLKGEILATQTVTPSGGPSSELVADPKLATEKMNVPGPVLKTIFGEIPAGQANELSKKSPPAPPPGSSTDETSGKTDGVLPGKKLILKNAPSSGK